MKRNCHPQPQVKWVPETYTLKRKRILKCIYSNRSGPTLTAVWSKAPPLIARCLSPLPGFESQPGHVGKLLVTWGQAVVFTGYSGFLHYLQLASHELPIIGINVTKNKIPNPNLTGVTTRFIDVQDRLWWSGRWVQKESMLFMYLGLSPYQVLYIIIVVLKQTVFKG